MKKIKNLYHGLCAAMREGEKEQKRKTEEELYAEQLDFDKYVKRWKVFRKSIREAVERNKEADDEQT